MQFMAEIVPGCIVEKNWLLLRRIGGMLNTVYFAKHGAHFYANELTDTQISMIKDNPYVNLITISTAPTNSVPINPFAEDDKVLENIETWAKQALGEGANVDPISTIETIETEAEAELKKRGRPKKVS